MPFTIRENPIRGGRQQPHQSALHDKGMLKKGVKIGV
jgi:hypothetical protein